MFVALEVLMEPEDLDAVLERWVPASSADVVTAPDEVLRHDLVLGGMQENSRTARASLPAGGILTC